MTLDVGTITIQAENMVIGREFAALERSTVTLKQDILIHSMILECDGRIVELEQAREEQVVHGARRLLNSICFTQGRSPCRPWEISQVKAGIQYHGGN